MPDKPNTERPQRIELGNGCYWEHRLTCVDWCGNVYDCFDNKIVDAIPILQAKAFAAAMAPQDRPQDGLREALEARVSELQQALKLAGIALKAIRQWRQDAHAYDTDMGHPLRDFGEEDWFKVAHTAGQALARVNKALAASPATQQTTKLDIPTTNEGWMRLLCDAKGRPDYTLINNIIAKAQHEAMAPAGQSEPLISSMPWWSKEEEDENTPVLSPETILEGK